MFSLNGKTALVTGGAVGIGQGIAIALAEAGADIATITNTPDANETKAQVEALGRKFYCLQADLMDPQAPAQSVAKIESEFAPIDILVNNAGMIRRQWAAEFSEQDWDDVIELNLNSVWRMSQVVGNSMITRGYGKIINIASLLAFQGGIRVPSYTAAKHGVAGITKALANEWASKGLTINAIAPGYIATDNTAAIRADAERSQQILERIPAGRWGTPADLMGSAIFLAAPASDYVNGHVLVVDGGWMAR